MARRAAAKEQLPATWDEELAKEAQVAKAEAGTGTANAFFSIRGGILSFNDVAIPQNEMAVVILDGILENVYYNTAFDPDSVASPKCFAYGRNEMTMKPHEVVVERGQEENATCMGCPQNEWGSAERGKGKACGNRRRISLVSAATLDERGRLAEIYDDEHFAISSAGLLKIPVMSVKGYVSYVNQITSVLQRPPYGVITLVKVVPDPTVMFRVNFTLLEKLPNRLIPIVRQRRADTQSILEQPYALDFDEPTAPTVARRGVDAKGRSTPARRAKF